MARNCPGWKLSFINLATSRLNTSYTLSTHGARPVPTGMDERG